MTDLTPLDLAHRAMSDAPDDDAARLRFYERLADSELFLALARPADGAQIDPELFELQEGRFVVVFDREDRLTEFCGGASAYVALSGRNVVQMLSGQQLGMAVNPDVAPSSILVTADAVEWLGQTLSQAPQQTQTLPRSFASPTDVPEALMVALDAKLATMAGLARHAYLAGVEYENGAAGHMLAFVDHRPGAEPALAGASAEALTFSGLEAGTLDVAFLSATDPNLASLARVALRFDLPDVVLPQGPTAPGMDPARPPRLR